MPIVLIVRELWIFVTSKGNIDNLKYCSYPTIRSFHLFIQPSDVEYATIAPHFVVVFQLQYVKHIKNSFSIHKHIYTCKICKLRKKHVIYINIIVKKLSSMGEYAWLIIF